jgi:osmotically-inducible protein OsmY
MKSRITHALAALLVAGAPLAFAQSTVQAPANLVDEPVASVSRSDERANAVAQALNADASLKAAKITVQPDEGNILLTGSSLTEAQRIQATKIASSLVGEGTVINTIAPDENVIAVPSAPEVDAAVLTVSPT